MGALRQIRRSLALRFSLWFAGWFTIGFVAIFALLYWLLGRQIESRDYEDLQQRLQQYATVYVQSGVRGLQRRIAEDSQQPNVRSLFLRLVGPGGSQVWGKIPPDWLQEDQSVVVVPDGWGRWREQTVSRVRITRDAQRDLAIVSQALPGNVLLQIGRSTDSREALLEPLRKTFAWVAGAVVLMGFGAGYFTARRATRPLREVVETARSILATGNLDARVPLPRANDEVAELVRHFNSVLDKNAGLLRAMREALDNVAHDLRTPLAGLRLTAESALQRRDVDAATGETLGDVIERSDQVLALLRALMEISEAEAGMLKLNRVSCDLGETARHAAELYEEVAEAAGVTLTIEAMPPVPVVADPTRLRQAVANLVDNAIKYTPAGGAVRVSAGSGDGRTFVRVTDNGPGVPVAEQTKVWDRLYRCDQSRTQSGLGLGLSMVRAIMTAHGGDAEVHDAPGGGARFELWLPAVEVPLLMPAETSHPGD
ncbi:sensor histidine kinase [Synoicihabitans lomoniglobus]|uniref:histidine kinase n=1 Tax=Synoicihabitans lomoniglobus TaxID=2909285 RepID=A0AAF0CP34_9BACT|nr:ATP-binding protein [Opitutaceae bacterium LMO-M01]WED65526.1 ATP-binding protein [Opitutaceae bacterium LMO-M01]